MRAKRAHERSPSMSSPRIGIWFIGARGGVAATATLGLVGAPKAARRIPSGLVSCLPQFAGSISPTGTRSSSAATRFATARCRDRSSGCIPIAACSMQRSSTPARTNLAAIDARIRPGSLANCGATIGGLAGPAMRDFAAEPAADSRRAAADAICRNSRQQTERRTRGRRQCGVHRAGGRQLEAARSVGTSWRSRSMNQPRIAAARQLAVCHRGARLGHAVHQLHAVAGLVAGGDPAIWPCSAAPATPARTARPAKRC